MSRKFPRKYSFVNFTFFFRTTRENASFWEFLRTEIGKKTFFGDWETTVYRYFIKKEKNRCAALRCIEVNNPDLNPGTYQKKEFRLVCQNRQ